MKDIKGENRKIVFQNLLTNNEFKIKILYD